MVYIENPLTKKQKMVYIEYNFLISTKYLIIASTNTMNLNHDGFDIYFDVKLF